jgi:hypothetical protein
MLAEEDENCRDKPASREAGSEVDCEVVMLVLRLAATVRNRVEEDNEAGLNSRDDPINMSLEKTFN